MRRTLFVTIAGLIFAFTFFYVLAWPSTISSRSPIDNTTGFNKVKPGESLYVGMGPFQVVGRKSVTIVSIRLHDPSPGIEFVDARLDRAGPGYVALGAPGEDVVPSIQRLPEAPGAVLRSGDGGGFYVTFTVNDPGSYRFRGIEVVYQAGWLTRTTVLGPSVTAVIPSS